MSGPDGTEAGRVLDRVVGRILSSRKYANVAPQIVRRVAEEALRIAPGEREAAKRARRKLHQVHGAFSTQVDYDRIEARIRELEERRGEPREARLEAARAVGLEVLSLHASTAERLGSLEELYAAIFRGMVSSPRPLRVLDLGCGLNPFAIPWMGLPAAAEYDVVDLDTRLAALLERYLAALGQAGRAAVGDVLAGGLPPGPWDAVLLMKLLPTLERQERGGAARIIRCIDAARVVVSFPRVSLGGRRKGMDEQYRRLVTGLAAETGFILEAFTFPTEMLYVCGRGSGPPRLGS